jgi:hypothetical protein
MTRPSASRARTSCGSRSEARPLKLPPSRSLPRPLEARPQSIRRCDSAGRANTDPPRGSAVSQLEVGQLSAVVVSDPELAMSIAIRTRPRTFQRTTRCSRGGFVDRSVIPPSTFWTARWCRRRPTCYRPTANRIPTPQRRARCRPRREFPALDLLPGLTATMWWRPSASNRNRRSGSNGI